MIKVKIFFQPDGRISGFDVSGHSGTAAEGEDIVCAGVSSLTDTAFLGITEYLHREVSYDAASGEAQNGTQGQSGRADRIDSANDAIGNLGNR